MADPRITGPMKQKKIPFDATRMIWGGFKTIVEM